MAYSNYIYSFQLEIEVRYPTAFNTISAEFVSQAMKSVFCIATIGFLTHTNPINNVQQSQTKVMRSAFKT